jgi:hypothetical protein
MVNPIFPAAEPNSVITDSTAFVKRPEPFWPRAVISPTKIAAKKSAKNACSRNQTIAATMSTTLRASTVRGPGAKARARGSGGIPRARQRRRARASR